MANYGILYPKLKYFFSAYFHQHWVDIYEWPDGKSSFQTVVNAFKDQDSKIIVNQVVQELEQFVDEHLPEADLREVMLHQLGSYMRAPGIGLTYRQWLEAVLEILKD